MKTNLPSFYSLTGYDTTSAFHGYGKKSCWKTFLNQPLVVVGIGRDGELAPIEQFVCHLYGRPDQSSVDQARLQLFGKAKNGLEILPPTKDTLELHTIRANYQAKIWLQADQQHIQVSSPVDTSAWINEEGCLKAVWTRLPPIPDACLELVTCGCKSKCRTVRCSCFRKDIKCYYACSCDAIECSNPAGPYIQVWIDEDTLSHSVTRWLDTSIGFVMHASYRNCKCCLSMNIICKFAC